MKIFAFLAFTLGLALCCLGAPPSALQYNPITTATPATVTNTARNMVLGTNNPGYLSRWAGMNPALQPGINGLTNGDTRNLNFNGSSFTTSSNTDTYVYGNLLLLALDDGQSLNQILYRDDGGNVRRIQYPTVPSFVAWWQSLTNEVATNAPVDGYVKVARGTKTAWEAPTSGTVTGQTIIVDTNFFRAVTSGTNTTLSAKTNAVLYGLTDTSISGNAERATMVTNALGAINVKGYGALGDGSHDDAPAIQAALNAAWQNNMTTAVSNRMVYVPAGTYVLGSTLLVTNARGVKLVGDGKVQSILIETGNGPALRTDGFWFSEICNIGFEATGGYSGGVVELDGNRDHTSTNTIAVQGNTVKDCSFHGHNVTADGLSITPVGSSWGMGSETLVLNCHFFECTNSGLRVYGMNAFQTSVIGGNYQDCTNYGICVLFGGSTHITGVGFQNGLNNAFDIYLNNGAGDADVIECCRSESLHWIYDSQKMSVIGWQANPAVFGWTQKTYSVGDIIVDNPTNRIYATNCYRCTIGGASGTNEPAWPNQTQEWGVGTTVTDGDVTWVRADEDGITVNVGSVRDSYFPYMRAGCVSLTDTLTFDNNEFTRPDWVGWYVYTDETARGSPRLIGNYLSSGGTYYSTKNRTQFGQSTPMLKSVAPIDIGTSPLLWTWKAGAQVGLTRNDYGTNLAETDPSILASFNVLGVYGSLGKPARFGSDVAGEAFDLIGGLGSGNAGGGAVNIWVQPPGDSGSERTAAQKRMVVEYNQTTVSNNLKVAGTVTASGAGLNSIPLSGLDWSTTNAAAFTNLIACRVPVFTNSGIIYYLTLSTNAP